MTRARGEMSEARYRHFTSVRVGLSRFAECERQALEMPRPVRSRRASMSAIVASDDPARHPIVLPAGGAQPKTIQKRRFSAVESRPSVSDFLASLNNQPTENARRSTTIFIFFTRSPVLYHFVKCINITD